MKSQSPLLGFNNNVRHKGRVFHIQTEDSGIRHPHIITHLFADGGRILKTTKTSYAEHVGENALAETVRAMMQEQHKAMFIALRDGQFDHLFDDEKPKKGSSPNVPAAPAEPRIDVPPAPQIIAPRGARHASPTAVTAPMLEAAPPSNRLPQASDGSEPPPSVKRRSNSRPKLQVDPAALQPPTNSRDADAFARAKTSPPPAKPKTDPPKVTPQSTRRTGVPLDSDMDVDLDTLERAAVEASQTPVYKQLHDLPPPPAAVLGKKGPTQTVGSYSVASPRQQAKSDPEIKPRPPMGSSPGDEGRRTNAGAPSPGRYAPSRPAAIFATTRPQEGASIFGEDLISEKSLDEVILSYLAEDLEGDAKK